MIPSREEEVRVELSAQAPTEEEMSTANKWASISQENISLVFAFTCVIAVVMDPLFFYVPFIDENNKCVGEDKRVLYAALISGVFTDFSYILHIILGILREPRFYNLMRRSSFLIDVVAILPLPQGLIIYTVYSARRGGMEETMSLNFAVFAQYISRMYRIFERFYKFRKNSALWFKGAFYFSMYVLVSHVIGGFWYFNSVQREITCWHQASCLGRPQNCPNLYCNDPPRSNSTLELIENLCSLDGSKFNYGPFGDGLKSGNMGPKHFLGKLLYFMWWGLKNLSNFGTNLNTTAYVWENCFAIFVSCTGLVLFAYLIGNMQECMQLAEAKEAARDQVQKKERDLLEWMKRRHLPIELMSNQIRADIKEKLEEGKDTDLGYLLSLPDSVKHVLCMRTLEAAMVQGLGRDENEWRMICDHLKPVIYRENKFVFRVGEPLDRMLFIIEGTVIIYTIGGTTGSPSMIHDVLEDGGVYGVGELRSWVSTPDTLVSLKNLPTATRNVKCHTKVEGFVLTAKDLKTVWHKLNESNNTTGEGDRT